MKGKLRKRTLKLSCLSIFACIIALALSGAVMNPQTAAVEHMLNKRVDIMENILSGNISFNEGKKQLKTVEQDKLLTDDLENIKAYQNSDYDKVIDFNILSLEKKSHVADLMTYESRICWTYQGMDKIYSQKCDYYIGVRSDDGRLKLVSFELL